MLFGARWWFCLAVLRCYLCVVDCVVCGTCTALWCVLDVWWCCVDALGRHVFVTNVVFCAMVVRSVDDKSDFTNSEWFRLAAMVYVPMPKCASQPTVSTGNLGWLVVDWHGIQDLHQQFVAPCFVVESC